MAVPYEIFVAEFTSKVTDRDLLMVDDITRDEMVFGYMHRAISNFRRECKYDLTTTRDDVNQEFNVDIPDEDIDEIADIVSEGMIVEWLKPYYFHQDLIQNIITTRDFSIYSPAELLKRVGDAFRQARKDFKNMRFQYSYDTGDLSTLHL